jgi:hypothetical protein
LRKIGFLLIEFKQFQFSIFRSEVILMFNNLGTLDRLIRLVLAGGFIYFGLFPYANSSLGVGLDIVGAVLALTGIYGNPLEIARLGGSLNYGTCNSL